MTITKEQFAWAPDELRVLLRYENQRLYLYCSGCGSRRQIAGKTAILKVWKTGYDLCITCNPNKEGERRLKFTKEEVNSWPQGCKKCAECAEIKVFENFHKHCSALFGYNTVCKECRLPKSKKNYENSALEYRIWHRAKQRATKKNLDFDLEESDIVIPEMCPILKMPIVMTANDDYSPSIDKIDPKGGYTKNNIQIVSKRGNMLKNNMTAEECQLVLEHLKL